MDRIKHQSAQVVRMDTLSTRERSRRMASIRSKNTKPELFVRTMLHALGYRFRIHQRQLPGSPDLVFASRKKVIFVHGCFWHGHRGCKVANIPQTRTQYWKDKFEANRRRDRRNRAQLSREGWRVLTVWECELKVPDRACGRLTAFLGPAKRAT